MKKFWNGKSSVNKLKLCKKIIAKIIRNCLAVMFFCIICYVFVMEKFSHLAISLLLLRIFSSNMKKLTIRKATHATWSIQPFLLCLQWFWIVLFFWVLLTHICAVKGWPFRKQHILDSSKCKKMRILNLKKNGRKFFKRVENTVGKGEIAHYEQFLLFPQGFQKTCTADTSKSDKGLSSERNWICVFSRKYIPRVSRGKDQL